MSLQLSDYEIYVNTYTISICVNLTMVYFLQTRITLQQCKNQFLKLIMHTNNKHQTKKYNSLKKKFSNQC